jgi:hypothetical protein
MSADRVAYHELGIPYQVGLRRRDHRATTVSIQEATNKITVQAWSLAFICTPSLFSTERTSATTAHLSRSTETSAFAFRHRECMRNAPFRPSFNCSRTSTLENNKLEVHKPHQVHVFSVDLLVLENMRVNFRKTMSSPAGPHRNHAQRWSTITNSSSRGRITRQTLRVFRCGLSDTLSTRASGM